MFDIFVNAVRDAVRDGVTKTPDKFIMSEDKLKVDPQLLKRIKHDIAVALSKNNMLKRGRPEKVNSAVRRSHGEIAVLLLIEIFPHLKELQETIAREFYQDIILFISESKKEEFYSRSLYLNNLVQLINLFLPFLTIQQLTELYPKTIKEKFPSLLLSLVPFEYDEVMVGRTDRVLSNEALHDNSLIKNIFEAIAQYMAKQSEIIKTPPAADAKYEIEPSLTTISHFLDAKDQVRFENLKTKIIFFFGNEVVSLHHTMFSVESKKWDNRLSETLRGIADINELNELVVGKLARKSTSSNYTTEDVNKWNLLFQESLNNTIALYKVFSVFMGCMLKDNLLKKINEFFPDIDNEKSNHIQKIMYCFLLQQLNIPPNPKILLSIKDILINCLKKEVNNFQKAFACVMLYYLSDSFIALFKNNKNLADDLCVIITSLKRFFIIERPKTSFDSVVEVEFYNYSAYEHYFADEGLTVNETLVNTAAVARFYAAVVLGRFVNLLQYDQYCDAVSNIFSLLKNYNDLCNKYSYSFSPYIENFLIQLQYPLVDNKCPINIVGGLCSSLKLYSERETDDLDTVSVLASASEDVASREKTDGFRVTGGLFDVQRISMLISHVISHLIIIPATMEVRLKDLLAQVLLNDLNTTQAPILQMRLYYIRAVLFNTQRNIVYIRSIFETLSSADYLKISGLAGLVYEYAGLPVPQTSKALISLSKDSPLSKGTADNDAKKGGVVGTTVTAGIAMVGVGMLTANTVSMNRAKYSLASTTNLKPV